MQKVFEQESLYSGRLLSGSKSDYTRRNPNNLVVFNANVIVDGQKVWYGDLDITKETKKLQKIANALQKSLYILREMDGRFDNENSPKLDRAVAVINPSV